MLKLGSIPSPSRGCTSTRGALPRYIERVSGKLVVLLVTSAVARGGGHGVRAGRARAREKLRWDRHGRKTLHRSSEQNFQSPPKSSATLGDPLNAAARTAAGQVLLGGLGGAVGGVVYWTAARLSRCVARLSRPPLEAIPHLQVGGSLPSVS